MERVKVLHIITRLIVGGAQENTLLTADGLDQARWSVDVISGPQTGPEGSLWGFAKERGISAESSDHLVREIHPVKDLLALIHLYRRIRQGGYAIVHTHSSKAGILGRIAARCARVPVIVHTVHGWGFHEHVSAARRFLFVFLERIAATFTDALIAVSQSDIDKGLGRRIGRPELYSVIRSGIELERFGNAVASESLYSQWGIPGDALVVGSVTRLSPQKAPLDLAEAFVRLQQRVPESWLVIVGDGPLRGDLEACLEERGIAERTTLTGVRQDVEDLLTRFDVFVLSSLWEGLPRVLPQAMAAGLPIVCTRTEGSAEAAKDGKNGFLVEPARLEEMADRVESLLGDAELRQRMGREGRRRASQFGVTEMVGQIDTLYQRLLVQRGL